MVIIITEFLPAEIFSVVRITVVRIVKMSPLKATVSSQWFGKLCLWKVDYKKGHWKDYSSSLIPILSSQMLVSFPLNICSEIIYHLSSVWLPAFVTHSAFLNHFQKSSHNLPQLLEGEEVQHILFLFITI